MNAEVLQVLAENVVGFGTRDAAGRRTGENIEGKDGD